MSNCYKFIKSRFNRTTPVTKQIFCWHKWEERMEISEEARSRCYFQKCKKCGKFRNLSYYR